MIADQLHRVFINEGDELGGVRLRKNCHHRLFVGK